MVAAGANAGDGARGEAAQPVRFEPFVLFQLCQIVGHRKNSISLNDGFSATGLSQEVIPCVQLIAPSP